MIRPRDAVVQWSTVERGLAMLITFLLGTRIYLFSSVTPGLLMALAIAPVWLSVLPRYRGARLVFACGLLAVVGGIGLAVFDRGYQIDAGNARWAAFLLLSVVVGSAAMMWARTLLEPTRIGLLFGCGSLLSALFSAAMSSGNAWKFALAVPVAMVVLSLAGMSRSRRYELVLLLVLAGVSVVFDSRAYSATFMLVFLLVLWQIRPTGWSSRASTARTLGLLLGVAIAIYYLGRALLLGGALGADAQLRSLDQIEKAGSLILGGRPELMATLTLLRLHPFGFGFGAVAGQREIVAANTAMSQVGYNTSDQYVERFMFGRGQIELHSILGDVWAGSGVLAFPFIIAIAVCAIFGLAYAISRSAASALLLFVGCWSLWNLAFGPLSTAAPSLILLLGLALPARVDPLRNPSSTEPMGKGHRL